MTVFTYSFILVYFASFAIVLLILSKQNSLSEALTIRGHWKKFDSSLTLNKKQLLMTTLLSVVFGIIYFCFVGWLFGTRAPQFIVSLTEDHLILATILVLVNPFFSLGKFINNERAKNNLPTVRGREQILGCFTAAWTGLISAPLIAGTFYVSVFVQDLGFTPVLAIPMCAWVFNTMVALRKHIDANGIYTHFDTLTPPSLDSNIRLGTLRDLAHTSFGHGFISRKKEEPVPAIFTELCLKRVLKIRGTSFIRASLGKGLSKFQISSLLHEKLLAPPTSDEITFLQENPCKSKVFFPKVGTVIVCRHIFRGHESPSPDFRLTMLAYNFAAPVNRCGENTCVVFAAPASDAESLVFPEDDPSSLQFELTSNSVEEIRALDSEGFLQTPDAEGSTLGPSVSHHLFVWVGASRRDAMYLGEFEVVSSVQVGGLSEEGKNEALRAKDQIEQRLNDLTATTNESPLAEDSTEIIELRSRMAELSGKLNPDDAKLRFLVRLENSVRDKLRQRLDQPDGFRDLR
jgi:hypothetical protein